MTNSLTVATRNGDVTIAAKPDLSPAGQPLVSVALTLGFLTYPVILSKREAHELARILTQAGHDAQGQADGFKIGRGAIVAGA